MIQSADDADENIKNKDTYVIISLATQVSFKAKYLFFYLRSSASSADK